ncbi:transposase [Ferrovum sp. PN-J185]
MTFYKYNDTKEGFHRKMKLIQKRAYGFKNFGSTPKEGAP